MSALGTGSWNADWAWSLPLIAMNVVIHVFCLGLFMDKVERALSRVRDRRRFASIFAMVMSVAVTVATILHGFEGASGLGLTGCWVLCRTAGRPCSTPSMP